jgi:hypothetical protein
VDGYLASEAAGNRIGSLSKTYSVPEDAFLQVYRPLLLGMVTGCIAEDLQGASVAASSSETEEAPVIPEESAPAETEPSVPQETAPEESIPEQTEPEETTPEETTPEETVPSEDETPETEPTQPDIGIDTDRFYGTVTSGEVNSVVSDYLNSSVVSGAASAMSVKMMEATVREIVTKKVSQFGGRLASVIGKSFRVDGDKISTTKSGAPK